MIKLNPEIYQRKLLFDQLYYSIHGELAENLARMYYGTSSLMKVIDIYRGYEMPIEKDTLPNLYAICNRVKKLLNYKEKINFFLVSSSIINASTCFSCDVEETPHIITLNSGLVNILTDDELTFTIGHEIGHLINKDGLIKKLVHFAGGNDDELDSYLKVRLDMYDLLCELEADRYGYLACGNEETAIKTMFKLAAGLDISKLGVSFDNLLKANKRAFNRYWKDDKDAGEGHPVHPIRIEALHIFANAENEKQLEKRMEKIEDKLRNLKPEEAVTLQLCAALAIKWADVVGGFNERTYQGVIKHLGSIFWFPEEYLSMMMEQDHEQLLDESIRIALSEGTYTATEILKMMAEIAYLDDVFTQKEIETLENMAEKLELPKSAMTNVLVSVFQDGFSPIVSTNFATGE